MRGFEFEVHSYRCGLEGMDMGMKPMLYFEDWEEKSVLVVCLHVALR